MSQSYQGKLEEFFHDDDVFHVEKRNNMFLEWIQTYFQKMERYQARSDAKGADAGEFVVHTPVL